MIHMSQLNNPYRMFVLFISQLNYIKTNRMINNDKLI